LNRALQDARDQKQVNAVPTWFANSADPPEPPFAGGPMVEKDRNDRERTQTIRFRDPF
jgi:hypothetical protein